MSGFLLDTNIPSELTRKISNPQVERWLDEANDEELYFSVISLGEILTGITILPASRRRDGLQEWLDETPGSTQRLFLGYEHEGTPRHVAPAVVVPLPRVQGRASARRIRRLDHRRRPSAGRPSRQR